MHLLHHSLFDSYISFIGNYLTRTFLLFVLFHFSLQTNASPQSTLNIDYNEIKTKIQTIQQNARNTYSTKLKTLIGVHIHEIFEKLQNPIRRVRIGFVDEEAVVVSLKLNVVDFLPHLF